MKVFGIVALAVFAGTIAAAGDIARGTSDANYNGGKARRPRAA